MKLIDKVREKFSAKKMRVECVYGPPSMFGIKEDNEKKYRPEHDIIEGIYGPPCGYEQQPVSVGVKDKGIDTKDNEKREESQ